MIGTIVILALPLALFAFSVAYDLRRGRAVWFRDFTGTVYVTRRDQPIRYWLMIASGAALAVIFAVLLACNLFPALGRWLEAVSAPR